MADLPTGWSQAEFDDYYANLAAGGDAARSEYINTRMLPALFELNGTLPTGWSEAEYTEYMTDLVSKGNAARLAYIDAHTLPEVAELVAEQLAIYTAPAVHFDRATYLTNAALVAADSNYFFWAGWFKYGEDPDPTHPNHIFWSVDPENTFTHWAYVQSDGIVASPARFETDLYSEAPAYSSVTTVSTSPVNEYTGVSAGTWYHVLVAIDETPGQRRAKLYVNGVDTGYVAQTGDDFTPLWNGLPFRVGHGVASSTSAYLGDMADVWVAPGINLLDDNDEVPEATLRLFIDAGGKPVDPWTAIAALGFPAVLLSGDAAEFSVNQGSGGAFTVTAGALTDASTSPST